MSGGEGQTGVVAEAMPMRPRRALLRALLALYVLWMAALAGLWYATVYAPRKAAPTPATQPTEVGQSGRGAGAGKAIATGAGGVGVVAVEAGTLGLGGVVSGTSWAGEADRKAVWGR